VNCQTELVEAGKLLHLPWKSSGLQLLKVKDSFEL